MPQKPDVAIVGMGYVGLTLAVTLAELGFRVWGCEREPEVVRRLNEGRSHLFEPGVDEILQTRVGLNLSVDTHLPQGFLGIVVVCVSTPVGFQNTPDLTNLRSAIHSVAETIADGALVIVRSTVPVGTCRRDVLPILRVANKEVYLASCPERTIQGQALRELRELPQVVGGMDEASARMAEEFWQQVSERVVSVSSLEAAEMVKLINNCHTDLVYSYGNEVAMMAQQVGLDPRELIQAANVGYPRPDLARPGFVAGPCMSKDSYLLLSSFDGAGYNPELVSGARKINDALPGKVALHFIDTINRHAGGVEGAKVLVCGFAYKGRPVTDDVRGTPTLPILQVLSEYPMRVYGHDYLVPAETISSWGATPVETLHQGFDGATGVMFVNEHPDYHGLPISELLAVMKDPAVLYDCWRMFDSDTVESLQGVHYAGIGYG